MRVKIRKVDKEFSEIVREMRVKCERCFKKGTQLSHFHGRRKESVRFDFDNVLVLCFFCHQYFHENPLEHILFMQKKLGKGFDLLTLRANTTKKKDDKMQDLVNKELRKALDTDSQ